VNRSTVARVSPRMVMITNSQTDDLSPRTLLSWVKIDAGTVTVVRDDLLPGGTKQRAVQAYLREAIAGGTRSFVYASPAPGFAQVALAYVSQRLGVECVLFCEQLGGDFHEFSLLAQEYGATIHPCASLEVAEKEATSYRDRVSACVKLPLGFADPSYMRIFHEMLAREWSYVTDGLGYVPQRIWLPVGSATLGTVFRDFLPDDVTLHCVDVRVLQPDDHRIRGLAARPGVTWYRAEQDFLQPTDDPPPIPSNSYYDAKLWSFITEFGAHRDLWWNVAR
jgi:hypothetical protein